MNKELTSTQKSYMVEQYLQYMYPANATEVAGLVNAVTDAEKHDMVTTTGGLKQLMQSKGAINTYLQPRVYRIHNDKPCYKQALSMGPLLLNRPVNRPRIVVYYYWDYGQWSVL